MHHHDGHDHSHHHRLDVTNASKMLIWGMFLNLAYVAAELAGGLITGSLALIADAGHNFSDASGLFLAWVAFRLIRIKFTKSNTYGRRKASILISVLNSLLIVFAVALIIREAIHRFSAPAIFDGYKVSIIAGAGVVINFLTAYLLHRDKEKDINLKGAYLHMIADGLVSLGVIVSGILIAVTDLPWIDPLVSILIAAVVLYSTWGLLRDSLRLATDAIPPGIHLDDVTEKMRRVKGVLDVHHIHIWPISTNENALTGHILVSKSSSPEDIEKIKHTLRHELEHLNIAHSTLEVEFADSHCKGKIC